MELLDLTVTDPVSELDAGPEFDGISFELAVRVAEVLLIGTPVVVAEPELLNAVPKVQVAQPISERLVELLRGYKGTSWQIWQLQRIRHAISYPLILVSSDQLPLIYTHSQRWIPKPNT